MKHTLPVADQLQYIYIVYNIEGEYCPTRHHPMTTKYRFCKFEMKPQLPTASTFFVLCFCCVHARSSWCTTDSINRLFQQVVELLTWSSKGIISPPKKKTNRMGHQLSRAPLLLLTFLFRISCLMKGSHVSGPRTCTDVKPWEDSGGTLVIMLNAWYFLGSTLLQG